MGPKDLYKKLGTSGYTEKQLGQNQLKNLQNNTSERTNMETSKSTENQMFPKFLN